MSAPREAGSVRLPNRPFAADDEIRDVIRGRLLESVAIKQQLAEDVAAATVVGRVLVDAYRNGNRLLVFGNGGSAADAQHIAGEFVGRFYLNRAALSAEALTVNTSIVTALGNDFGFDAVFERQVEATGRPGDIAIGISTSGNAENVLRGIRAGKRAGLVTVGMTGRTGGRLAGEVDHLVAVPSDDTPRIQEVHILLGHVWSEIVEAALFGAPV